MTTKKVDNGHSEERNGWLYISIQGSARERGLAYGKLCADEFANVQKMLGFFMMESYGQPWDYFIKLINEDFGVDSDSAKEFKEIYEEMTAIAEGVNAEGGKTTMEEIIAWNFYLSMPYWLSSKDSGVSGAKRGS